MDNTDSDWIQQERDHEYKMAKLKRDGDADRRRNRANMLESIAVAAGIVLAIAVVVAGLVHWGNSAGERGMQLEVACIESDGTWTGLGGGSPVCIKRVEQ